MTEPLAQTVTADEAEFLRGLIENGYGPLAREKPMSYRNEDGHSRLWRPVEAVEATGKARCRLCSQTIPKGARCVRFGFDPYGEGGWGRLSRAYIHLTPCPGEEERVTEHRNTLPEYELEAATKIPDEEDVGLGIGAGDRVTIVESHEIYPGEEGTVQAVARGQGFYEGSLVVDVLVDGTSEAERFRPEEVDFA